MITIFFFPGKQIWRNCNHSVFGLTGISADKKENYAKRMYDSLTSVFTLTNESKLNWFVNAGFGYEHVLFVVVAADNQVLI